MKILETMSRLAKKVVRWMVNPDPDANTLGRDVCQLAFVLLIFGLMIAIVFGGNKDLIVATIFSCLLILVIGVLMIVWNLLWDFWLYPTLRILENRLYIWSHSD